LERRGIAFIGAGGVAAYQAYALRALPSFYRDAPPVELVAVTSPTEEHRTSFAARHGFAAAVPIEALAARTDVDTLYILSPNARHFAHLQLAASMPGLRRVYIEKPLCVTEEEERAIAAGELSFAPGVRITAGFQFLRSSPARYAHQLWRERDFGPPVHFQARYLHSGYLDAGYRGARAVRLRPAPEGGAMIDLGSHALSLIAAFLGEELEVVEARQSRGFDGVASDLCTIALCRDRASGAVGSVTASRISAGAAELLELEIRCERGGLRFSTDEPETVEVFSSTAGESTIVRTRGDFSPYSEFPKGGTIGGWLRSFVHAAYLFLNDLDEPPQTGLRHALTVQRLLREATQRLRG